MQINVWGFVQKPGRYEVPSSTDLVQLLSFAGGPSEYAEMDNVKITRLIKRDSTFGKHEITLDLDDLKNLKDEDLVLYPGDTIVIGHTAWLTFRDAFTVVATAAIVTTAITQIISVSRK